ncbi:F-box protein At5g51380-like [Nymphaea colorata]|nr:F-box protein At5g51380-like [Nymphaea colorata]
MPSFNPPKKPSNPWKPPKSSWVPAFFLTRNPKTLNNHVFFKMQLEEDQQGKRRSDLSLLLSDQILAGILSKLPLPQLSCSLVCKRWCRIHGSLLQSLKLHDWSFLERGRMVSRFPNLTDVDLINACIKRVPTSNWGLVLTHSMVTIPLDTSDLDLSGELLGEGRRLVPESLDQGLRALARGCPNLRRLRVVDVSRPIDDEGRAFSTADGYEGKALDTGLSMIAAECLMLQELELHQCTDFSLRSISNCRNLQVLKVVGCSEGLYGSVVSDVGLTTLAHGCKRLVKLELCGCEGSYDGISAIGMCCFMLEELTLCDHRMEGGWIAGLKSCGNLKSLRLQSCRRIDSDPGPAEHLGLCPTLEKLQLQRCNVRDKQGMSALFTVCGTVKELEFQDCWGLEDEIFSIGSCCRRVKSLSLEGCSLLTTEGLESLVLSWKELQRLRVVSCNNIKDIEVTPSLASVFSVLKELKWRPDTKSVLADSLFGTGMGGKGGKFFKRV